jgi:hypothetical protein
MFHHQGITSLRLAFIILSVLLSFLYVVGFMLIGWLWATTGRLTAASGTAADYPLAARLESYPRTTARQWLTPAGQ